MSLNGTGCTIVGLIGRTCISDGGSDKIPNAQVAWYIRKTAVITIIPSGPTAATGAGRL